MLKGLYWKQRKVQMLSVQQRDVGVLLQLAVSCRHEEVHVSKMAAVHKQAGVQTPWKDIDAAVQHIPVHICLYTMIF